MAIRELPHYVSARPDYHHVDASEMARKYAEGKVPALIALDTETCYDPALKAPEAICKWINGGRNNRPFGLSAYWAGEGYWVTGDLRALRPMLADTAIMKIFHNSQYDVLMLLNLGIEVADPIMDTMCMIKLIDEEFECKLPGPDGKPKRDEHGKLVLKKSAALKNLAYHFLGADAHDLEDLVDECRAVIASNTGRPKAEVGYAEVPFHIMKDYAIADTEYTYRLFHLFSPMMDEQALWPPYQDSINAMRAVVEMERTGVPVDLALMAEDEKKLNALLEAELAAMVAAAGPFNPGSGPELVEAFGRLGVAWQWFTESGDFATDKATLALLPAEVQPFVKHLLRWRKAGKLLSTYIHGVRDYVQEDGRVHASFYLWPDDRDRGSAKTGRMSSSNCNMQNITNAEVVFEEDGEEDISIAPRRYFVPPVDHIILEMDYSQQEYRMLAHYGNDEAFMDLVHRGYDVHQGTASIIFDVPYEEVTKPQRQIAKTTNFSLVYGSSNLAFANSLRRANKQPGIDEAACRAGTQPLYKLTAAYNVPPYKCAKCEAAPQGDNDTCRRCKQRFIDMVQTDEAKAGLELFLSLDVQESVAHAAAVKKQYFARFPGIQNFIKQCGDVAAKRGYVRYWNGRRRHFKRPKEQSYQAPNSLIQGGAGEIMKKKLYVVNKFLLDGGYRARPCNSVHDAIYFLIPDDERSVVPQLKAIMDDLPFRVPITVDVKWSAKSWADEEEWEG